MLNVYKNVRSVLMVTTITGQLFQSKINMTDQNKIGQLDSDQMRAGFYGSDQLYNFYPKYIQLCKLIEGKTIWYDQSAFTLTVVVTRMDPQSGLF